MLLLSSVSLHSRCTAPPSQSASPRSVRNLHCRPGPAPPVPAGSCSVTGSPAYRTSVSPSSSARSGKASWRLRRTTRWERNSLAPGRRGRNHRGKSFLLRRMMTLNYFLHNKEEKFLLKKDLKNQTGKKCFELLSCC